MQSYDSTFGKQATDAFTLHQNGVAQSFPSRPAVPVFNDMNDYWFPPDASIRHFGWSGVAVPKTGTVIKVSSTTSDGNFMQVLVNP